MSAIWLYMDMGPMNSAVPVSSGGKGLVIGQQVMYESFQEIDR